VEGHIEHQQKVLQLLKDNLAITQNKMKQKENQHHIEREFEVGIGFFLGYDHTDRCPFVGILFQACAHPS
jgi:hypothetical protein